MIVYRYWLLLLSAKSLKGANNYRQKVLKGAHKSLQNTPKGASNSNLNVFGHAIRCFRRGDFLFKFEF